MKNLNQIIKRKKEIFSNEIPTDEGIEELLQLYDRLLNLSINEINKRYNYRKICLNLMFECFICKSKENLEVHHKDGDKNNNNINNLILLCKNHHNQIHNSITLNSN